jgi:phage terminase large subunit-like protein
MIDPARLLEGVSAAEAERLLYEWPLWARPDQLAPDEDWRVWCLLGGRGSGKTRSAAEWIRQQVESGRHQQLAVIAPTITACRQVCVEGPSGILAVSPPHLRPVYEPANRRLVWPDLGAVCYTYGSEEPDRLRGPSLSCCWVDEFCAMQDQAGLWLILQMAVRMPGNRGAIPQICVSTTPKPTPLFREILSDAKTVVTRSKTIDNCKHLDASALQFYLKTYAGTSLGRQELDAELIEDTPGAMFSRALLERARISRERAPRFFSRVVTSIDPSISYGPTSDECGIVSCGIDDNTGISYVIEDRSCIASPDYWARQALDMHRKNMGDLIVFEQNVGGALVDHVLRQYDRRVRVRSVHASRSKRTRIEPIVSLFEQGRVRLIGSFPALEDEAATWCPDEPGARSRSRSPNRLDAMTQALWELAVRPHRVHEQRRESPKIIALYQR